MKKSNKLQLKLVKGQESSKIVKGKFPPLQIDKKIEVIEQIITFQSKKRHYPYVLFQGKSINFLGIVLSRQSSDLLNMIARKLIISMHFHGINLIQYYFPKELNSIKLIVLLKWESIDEFKKILSNLDEIQIKFDGSLKKFANFNSKLWFGNVKSAPIIERSKTKIWFIPMEICSQGGNDGKKLLIGRNEPGTSAHFLY